MIPILLLMLFSSLWSMILIEYFDPFIQLRKIMGFYYHETDTGLMRHLTAFNPFMDFILHCLTKLLNCSLCMSYWIFAISYLIIFSSGMGFLFGAGVYFLTMIIKKILDI